MTLRFHEIAEANHRIQNPISVDKLKMLGEFCGLKEGMRVLDLACGKGEMLVNWVQNFGIYGVGVDISNVFIKAAEDKAFQRAVGNKLNFVVGDAAEYPEAHHEFDVVTCLGATWIGGGLIGTLNLMRTALKSRDGLLVIGEPFWNEPPDSQAISALHVESDTFTSLSGTLDRFEEAGLSLVEMVIADRDEWDRYEAQQWQAVDQFLQENPDDPEAAALQRWNAENQRNYLAYGRRYMGWGVFVLRETAPLSTEHVQIDQPDRPVGVDIADNMLWVRLQDNRVIGNPLDWFPWLKDATPDAVDNYEMTAIGIEWPELGKRIEVSQMMRGR